MRIIFTAASFSQHNYDANTTTLNKETILMREGRGITFPLQKRERIPATRQRARRWHGPANTLT